MRRRILRAAGILLLLAVVAGLIYASPMLFMHPEPSGQIAGAEVYAAQAGLGSIYLLPLEEGWLAIDAGASASRAEASLAELGIDAAEVRYILMTHGDSDHVGGLPLFPEAQLYISEELSQTVFLNSAPGRESLPGVAYDRVQVVADGEQLELGGRTIRCVALPGHTPGSMAYLVDADYIFSGDAVRLDGDSLRLHPYTMDSSTLEQNIRIIRQQQAEKLFTAHYGVYELQGQAA